jgi:hypothetical protein
MTFKLEVIKAQMNRKEAMSYLKNLDTDHEEIDRVASYEFYKNGGIDALGYNSYNACLKDNLQNRNPATIYRYMQAGYVEDVISEHPGSITLTTLLEIAKYPKKHWELIWETATKHYGDDDTNISVEQIKATINILVKRKKLSPLPETKRSKEAKSNQLNKIITSLDDFEIDHLKMLQGAIEKIIEEDDE